MKKLQAISVLSLLLAGMTATTGASETVKISNNPNFLFILADDLAFDALGATSSDSIYTPNLDRLRSQGVIFNQVYNSGSWSMAVCVASRTMLNSGYQVWRAEQYEKKRPSTPVWSELMKNAGYETYFTGKWHGPGVSPKLIFDHTGTIRGGMPSQSKDCYARKFDPAAPDVWTASDTRYGGYWEGGTHWTEVTASESINFIKKAAVRKKPFFIYTAFNAPHDPRQSAKKYLSMYPLQKIAVPDHFLPDYPYAKAIGCGPTLRDEQLAPFPRTARSIQMNRQEYYASISFLDEQIGRILDQLKVSGKADNTYVIFTADQGLSIGGHGLMGKQNLYDASVRVPMFISGPRLSPGRSVDSFIYIQDLMPTVLELANTAVPAHVEFKSFKLLLEGKSGAKTEDAVYGGILNLQRMIRTQNYKMMIYPKAKKVRLYDIKNDPSELHDIAGVPQSKAIVDSLFSRLRAMQGQLNDKIDILTAYHAFLKTVSPSAPE